MDTLWQDIRFGIRALLKRPGFTVVALVSLALGIGANTAIFTVTNSVFLHSIPVRDIGSLSLIQTQDRATKSTNTLQARSPVSVKNFEDFRAQNDVFTEIAAFVPWGVTFSGRGDPQPFPVQLVSANYFSLLGVPAAIGRAFLPGEDAEPGENAVCVLSDSLWKRHFGSDPAIVGKSIVLNSVPFTVIGIAPEGFKGTVTVGNPEMVWMPMSMHAQVLSGPVEAMYSNRRLRLANLFGRLKPGVAISQADAEMKTIASRLEREYPMENNGRTAQVSPLSEAALGGLPRAQLIIAAIALTAVVGLVLLIACFNLANMLLARAAQREREMSIRNALGAGRWRLIRQLVTESVLLAIGGGTLGLAIAAWGSRLLWSFRPAFLTAGAIDLRLDPRVFAFTAAISLVTGVFFGLVPAIRASRPSLNDILKTGGRGNTSAMSAALRSVLVVSQVALTVIALAGAGLFIRSMQNAQRIDPGFEPRNLFSFAMDLSTLRWTPQHTSEFQRAVMDRVRDIAGVESVAVSTNPPIGAGVFLTALTPEQAAQPNARGTLVAVDAISPGYFSTLGIPVKQGRAFTEFDRADTTPVIALNQAAARLFFPGEEAIGKRLTFLGQNVMREVVAVTGDTVVATIGETPQAVLYLPITQGPQPQVTINVRTKAVPEAVLPVALAQVHQMNGTLALAFPQTIQQLIGNGLWAPRMGAALFGIFGGLGLVLAAIGIYGVMAYMVAQRTNEIGIRMALGAARGDVIGMVIGHGMRLTALGILAGLAGGLAVTRLMATLLFGISPADPLTFSLVSAVLAIAALVATWIPAWRAASIDPVIALRD